jgi:hypothetical protein
MVALTPSAVALAFLLRRAPAIDTPADPQSCSPCDRCGSVARERCPALNHEHLAA